MKSITDCYPLRIATVVFGFLYLTSSANLGAQSIPESHMAARDTLIARFNGGDLSNVYSLFDTTFTSKIPEGRLMDFLKGNRNSGRIVHAKLESELDGVFTYLLEFELRDMRMRLKATPQGKITVFGLSSAPPPRLSKPKRLKTNNKKRSPLDLAIDSAVLEYYHNAGAHALSIGIIIKGRKYSYHYQEVESGNQPLPSDNTLYEIGSITKTFTATLLAQAVVDKKVSLDDDIRKYLTGDYPNLSYGGVAISLKHLANHTSRLPILPGDITEKPGYNALTPESHYDSLAFFEALGKVALDTVPGFKFGYSNWGMALLGHILEQVYSQPYPELVRRLITDPFRMSNTTIADKEVADRVATPYSENGKVVPVMQGDYFSPAGGFCSDIVDMCLFLEHQIREHPEAVQLTHTPTRNNVGLGWGVRNTASIRDVQHSGSTQGSNANITAFPDLQTGLVVLTNSKTDPGPLVRRIQTILVRMSFARAK